jgi:hypothetical protein
MIKPRWQLVAKLNDLTQELKLMAKLNDQIQRFKLMTKLIHLN